MILANIDKIEDCEVIRFIVDFLIEAQPSLINNRRLRRKIKAMKVREETYWVQCSQTKPFHSLVLTGTAS